MLGELGELTILKILADAFKQSRYYPDTTHIVKINKLTYKYNEKNRRITIDRLELTITYAKDLPEEFLRLIIIKQLLKFLDNETIIKIYRGKK